MSENLCRVVKEYTKHESEFCLKPYSFVNEFTQACHLITWRNTSVNLAFLEQKCGLEVWVSDGTILCLPSSNSYKCLGEKELIVELLKLDKTLAVMFIYSLFLNAKRKIRSAAADAYTVYAAAAYDAADAAYAAAAAAVYAAAAYDAAAADKYIKKAFKLLIKYRKEVLK